MGVAGKCSPLRGQRSQEEACRPRGPDPTPGPLAHPCRKGCGGPHGGLREPPPPCSPRNGLWSPWGLEDGHALTRASLTTWTAMAAPRSPPCCPGHAGTWRLPAGSGLAQSSPHPRAWAGRRPPSPASCPYLLPWNHLSERRPDLPEAHTPTHPSAPCACGVSPALRAGPPGSSPGPLPSDVPAAPAHAALCRARSGEGGAAQARAEGGEAQAGAEGGAVLGQGGPRGCRVRLLWGPCRGREGCEGARSAGRKVRK